MKRQNTNVSIVLIILCFIALGCHGSADSHAAADRAIDEFHTRYNEDKFVEISDARDKRMKDSAPPDHFINLLTGLKEKFGMVKESKEVSTKESELGFEYSIDRQTVFEKGTGTEKFRFSITGDKATLLSYVLRSDDFVK